VHVSPQPTIAYGENVVPPDPELLRQEAMEQPERLQTHNDVRAERRLEEGDPATEILRVLGKSAHT